MKLGKLSTTHVALCMCAVILSAAISFCFLAVLHFESRYLTARHFVSSITSAYEQVDRIGTVVAIDPEHHLIQFQRSPDRALASDMIISLDDQTNIQEQHFEYSGNVVVGIDKTTPAQFSDIKVGQRAAIRIDPSSEKLRAILVLLGGVTQ